jgi:hypothetical protein
MDSASQMGAQVTRSTLLLMMLSVTLVAAAAPNATATERYALIITGASGGSDYQEKYRAWRTAMVSVLENTFEYPHDHVIVLADDENPDLRKATRTEVRAALAGLARRMTRDDQLLVLLIGHGTGTDPDDAKFNLVGPDLSAAEWADLLQPVRGRVVFVNTSGGSFPFLERLAAKDRIVLSANDSASQQFDTVFPEYFVRAFGDEAADSDKNGRVSIWEAFAYASRGVRASFEEKGQLATERALLDDTGAGQGREADRPGNDGALAQVTYLQPEPAIPDTGNAELTSLTRLRAELDRQLEALRAKKPSMDQDEYQQALERLLLEIAQVDRQIRARS